MVLVVPEQAQSPDTLLSAAGLHTLLYTNRPPGPEIAAHTNITLTQLHKYITLTVKQNHGAILDVFWGTGFLVSIAVWHIRDFSQSSLGVNVVEDGKLHHTADEYTVAHLTEFPKINLVASASFELKAKLFCPLWLRTDTCFYWMKQWNETPF